MATPTTIYCTRCHSTVPWGPYCAECSAYLEFAGEPPWDPKITQTLESSSRDEDESVQVVVHESVEEVTATAVTEVPQEFAHLFHPDEPASSSRISGTNLLEVALIALIGAVIVFFVGQLANWWVASALGIFVLGWCALLVSSWLSDRKPAVVELAVVTYTEVVEVQQVEVIEDPGFEDPGFEDPGFEDPGFEDPDIDKPTPAVLEARSPQELPPQVVQRTVASTTRSVLGDVPCSVCGQLNDSARIFCDWCGAPMPGAELQPAAIRSFTESDEEANTPEQNKPPRRLSGSWRTQIIVFSLLGVFVSAVVFTLFGPNAFRVQFGLTQVYQSINQFIIPTAGNIVTPVNVVASSTLQGTQPQAASGGDGRTFWASAPSYGNGAGSTLEFILNDITTIDRMQILPGIQGSQFGIRALATPKDITLTFMDGSSFDTQLLRVNTDRDFRQLVEFPRTKTNKVTMKIRTVYPASGESVQSWGEVAISGVEFISPPAPPQFLRLPTEMPAPRNLPGS
jgi:hypothetical protein